MPTETPVAEQFELEGMPDGGVPSDVRATAERLVRKKNTLKAMKEELDTEEQLLLDNMAREKVRAVLVILDGARYMVTNDARAPKIKIRELAEPGQ